MSYGHSEDAKSQCFFASLFTRHSEILIIVDARLSCFFGAFCWFDDYFNHRNFRFGLLVVQLHSFDISVTTLHDCCGYKLLNDQISTGISTELM